jgi:lysyl endopeptidase
VVPFPDVDVADATDLHAVVSQPNGTADANPSGDEQDYAYLIAPTTELATMHFEIRTDGYANETTWKLYNSNDQVVVQDPPGNYSNNTTYNYWWTLNPNECYRLEVLDSYGDGLCCGFGSGYYRLRSNGVLIAEDSQFGGVTKAHFVTGAAVGIAENSLENGLSMFPNPTSGEVSLQFELPASTTLYFVVRDALGHEVMQLTEGFGPGIQRTNIDLGELANGSYFITIRSDNMAATRKVTVVH